MTFPTIPNTTPGINITAEEAVNLLLASVAFEELGLAHIINAEAEKIQFLLGTLPGQTTSVPPTIDDIISIDRSVQMMLRTVIKQQMLLQFKLEDVLDISTSSTTTETTTTMTSTTTSTTATTTTMTAVSQPLFIFGDIASAGGNFESITVDSEDNAFYHSDFAPVITGYTFTETPIIGVPTIPQPSIHLVKEVSVNQGTSWDDANTPIGPELPMGAKAWFRITISNNGNVPLNNVTITDPSIGFIRIIKTLVNGSGVQIKAVPL